MKNRLCKIKDSNGKTLKAGGIVVSGDSHNRYILMIYRSEYNDWVFPKGHTEEGESAEESAIREIGEETGLKVSNGEILPDFLYSNEGNLSGIIVKMFLFKSDRDKVSTEDGCSAQWVKIAEVENRLTYKNLKQYFRSLKNLIKLMQLVKLIPISATSFSFLIRILSTPARVFFVHRRAVRAFLF